MSDSSDRAAAQWFGADGRIVPAEVSFGPDGEVRAKNAEDESRAVPISVVSVSPRMANIPRRIEFPDGIALSVDDNDFVDSALRRARRMRGARMLHIFESRPAWAAVFLAIALLVGWAGVAHGIPLIGKVIAENISPESLRDLSDQARRAMTARDILAESELAEDDRARAERLFVNLASRFARDGVDYRLRFYKMEFGGREIPNAFALPDGTVILTDRLAALADDDELTAVFAHEIAHAQKRHGARMLAQTAGAAGLGALIFGDVTGALGAALVSAEYSRAFEREADCFAYRALSQVGVDWRHLGGALRKMERDSASPPIVAREAEAAGEGESAEEKLLKADAAMKTALEGLVNFLSTHPPTEARANPQEHCK